MFLDERYLAQRSNKGLAYAVLAPSFGQVVNDHAVAAVAVRHPSLVAEQLLAPVAAAFVGAGEATFAGTAAVDVVPSGVTKSTTVERLLTDAGHPGESAVVFGDMPNDLGSSMLGMGVRRRQRPPTGAPGRRRDRAEQRRRWRGPH